MKPFFDYKNTIVNWGESQSLCNNSLNTFQITRSLLALSSLLTIIFSSHNVLFSTTTLDYNNQIPFYNFTFFKLFGYSRIGLAILIYILTLIIVISGYLPKISSIIHWYLSFSFSINSFNVDGGDQIIPVICLLLIPISLCDNRKNTWLSVIENKVSSYRIFLSNLFLKLIQLQISIIYLSSGVSKLNVPEWLDGTAYYYWFNDKAVGAPPYIKALVGNLFSNSFAVTTVTWGTIIFEVLLFCCLFSKNITFRKVMFKIGLIFHILTAIVHGILSFCIVMIGCLIIYLRSDDKKVLT